jgi:hypothetical protein
MRSTVLRTGPTILLVAVLAMLGLAATAAAHSSAAGKPARGPAIVVKTAHQARGTVSLHVTTRSELRSAVIRLDGHRVDPIHRAGGDSDARSCSTLPTGSGSGAIGSR